MEWGRGGRRLRTRCCSGNNGHQKTREVLRNSASESDRCAVPPGRPTLSCELTMESSRGSGWKTSGGGWIGTGKPGMGQ